MYAKHATSTGYGLIEVYQRR